MTYSAGTLSDGQVAATWGAVYTATGPTLVRSIEIYNTGSTVETVAVGITRSGGTRRQIRQVLLSANEAASFDEVYSLSTGDSLDAQTTTATQVDYVVMGAAS